MVIDNSNTLSEISEKTMKCFLHKDEENIFCCINVVLFVLYIAIQTVIHKEFLCSIALQIFI